MTYPPETAYPHWSEQLVWVKPIPWEMFFALISTICIIAQL